MLNHTIIFYLPSTHAQKPVPSLVRPLVVIFTPETAQSPPSPQNQPLQALPTDQFLS